MTLVFARLEPTESGDMMNPIVAAVGKMSKQVVPVISFFEPKFKCWSAVLAMEKAMVAAVGVEAKMVWTIS